MPENAESLLNAPFPDLPLTQWIGPVSSFDELRGKIIAVDFFATWCMPCLAGIPRNNDLMQRLGDRGVVVLGICASSGAESLQTIAEERGIAYPLVRDEKRTAEKALRVRWYPCHFVIDREGIIRADRAKFDVAQACIEELLAAEDAG